ncbi:hypothetical protein KPH14_003814 [Odynerus spinipes]|uniref:Uncharacterized protein n=1 Tax=Odynerus spinipes TaxID=1348599 RepID=A0AAD9RXQ8_9HYME|nr:hypothetical protein KPH14_003814 [Odynerus spinipes]
MSYLDLSGISGISTISRISRSNCSRLMGGIDSILIPNELNHQSSFIQKSGKDAISTNQDSSSFTNVTKSFAACQNSISEYAKAKLVFECIEEVCLNKNNKLPEETAEKLKGLLQLHETKKIKNFSPMAKYASQDLTILGITEFPDFKLSYEEKLNVKACVESLLSEKIHDFLVKYQELGGNLKELQRLNGLEARSKLQENVDLEVLEWKDKFENICTQCEDYSLHCADLINEWKRIKNIDINEVYHEKAQSLFLQSQIAEVQSKVTKLTCLIRMYKETPTTIDAYRILSNILDDKLLEINNEIKRKENLKKLYLDLQNTEYDNILRTYLQLCNVIKKKKQIMQML